MHPSESSPDDAIAIVVLTHSRVHLLQRCVENVLLRTSEATREIVIWDNGSTDETWAYLQTLDDPRIQIARTETNIGMNAYARAFSRTSAPYMLQLDDDVTGAPANWDATLLDAFKRLPDVGYLAADLVDDPHDVTSHYRHRVRPHEYVASDERGVRLLLGPAGGYCAITSREISDRVGGFRERAGEVFWLEDSAYITEVQRLGLRGVVLADLAVHHTGGPYYADEPREKVEYWERYWADRVRRDSIKQILVRVPLVRRLNARFDWFVAPS
jgi:GT2 family glycosyltransferase